MGHGLTMLGAAAALALGLGGAGVGVLQTQKAQAAEAARASAAARLQALEDREAIKALFNAYGGTLDARDFDGFQKLWARDAVYEGGGGLNAKGPAAIRAQLEGMMGKNPMGLAEPNFHLFLNETIHMDGDHATALSKSLFVAPNAAGRGEIIFVAHYDDVLVREDGQWKFEKRVVHGDIPAPRRAG